ncbi:hypothetical protein [Nocardia testacea]|uniref:hypothetical protein n=1 Tax=Nocardia testacea TaxID=248551 RepID=UPI000585AD9E|nr:hypothetical protein [Nocardia testacea]
MTTAESRPRSRRHDPHTYEVLGRVLHVLCGTQGPLAECLAFRLWPTLTGAGYVLAWSGVRPTEDEIVQYLGEAAANDEVTTTLSPGDVLFKKGHYCTLVKIRGVEFQLRSEGMPEPETFAAMGEYWRTGTLTPRR